MLVQPTYDDVAAAHITAITAAEHHTVGLQNTCALLNTLKTTVQGKPLLVRQLNDDQAAVFWPDVQRARARWDLSRRLLVASIASEQQEFTLDNVSILGQNADSDALLMAARQQLRRRRIEPAVLADVVCVTQLLCQRLKTTDSYDAVIVASGRLDPRSASLQEIADAFVETHPFHAPAFLHRAAVRIAAGNPFGALHDVWYVLLVLQVSRGNDNHDDEDDESSFTRRACILLSRCSRLVPYIGLDILYSTADGKPSKPHIHLVWPRLSPSQRERHTEILSVVMHNVHPASDEKYVFHAFAWVPRGPNDFVLQRLPPKFCMLVPGRIAACELPTQKEDFDALQGLGTLTFVSTKQKLLPVSSWCVGTCHSILQLSIPSQQLPSIAQTDAFLAQSSAATMAIILDDSASSWTAALATAWILAFGYNNTVQLCLRCTDMLRIGEQSSLFIGCCCEATCAFNLRPPVMQTKDALSRVHSNNQASVKAFAIMFYNELWRRYGILKKSEVGADRRLIIYPDLALGSELDKHLLEVVGHPSQNTPELIVLCGTPGSGKTRLRMMLANALEGRVSVACQDELRSRGECESVVANAVRAGACVIVDRCNPTVADRAAWLKVAFQPASAVVVHVDTPKQLCIFRAKMRVNHPTVTAKNSVSIINAVSRVFETPNEADFRHGFSAVYTVRGRCAMEDFVKRMAATKLLNSGSVLAVQSTVSLSESSSSSVAPNKSHDMSIALKPSTEVLKRESRRGSPTSRLKNFFKFPRTSHLIDVGGNAVSEDDVVMTDEQRAELNLFLRGATGGSNCVLTIEEKVDGANLGFSIDVSTDMIVAQNRSHFVNSKSHAQFKLLQYFIQTHETDLRQLLQNGKRVLYGEWCYARHSISYSRLPSVFLAFDIFDVNQKKFLSRTRFHEEISGTNICCVQRVEVAHDMDENSLTRLALKCPSFYYDGMAEGIYLRVDEDDWLVTRAKIVRPDFICGNSHWTSRPPEKNHFVAI